MRDREQSQQGRHPAPGRAAAPGRSPIRNEAMFERLGEAVWTRRTTPGHADALRAVQAFGGNRAVSDWLGGSRPRSAITVQRWPDVAARSFRALLAEQEKHRQMLDQADRDVTTVGFEHEFAQMEAGSPLHGISHLELANSKETVGPNQLPFTLETDASNEVELVSPPLLVKTRSGVPIPDPHTVQVIDDLIQARLVEVVNGKPTFEGLLSEFANDPGLTFPLGQLAIKAENLTPRTQGDFHKDAATLPPKDIAGVRIVPSEKFGTKAIDTQVNLATSAEVAHAFTVTSTRKPSHYEQALLAVQQEIHNLLTVAHCRTGQPLSPKLAIFYPALARALAGQLAVPSIRHIQQAQTKAFTAEQPQERQQARKGLQTEEFRFHAMLSSRVKDVAGVWTKDSLVHVGLGLLGPGEWSAVAAVAADLNLVHNIERLQPPKFGDQKLQPTFTEVFGEAIELVVAAVKTLSSAASIILSSKPSSAEGKSGGSGKEEALTSAVPFGPEKRPPFMSHNAWFIGPRQDTYVPAHQVGLAAWPDTRLHVVEARSDPARSLAAVTARDLLHASPDASDDEIAGMLRVRGFGAREVAAVRRQVAGELIDREPRDKVLRRLGLGEQDAPSFLYVPVDATAAERRQRGERHLARRVPADAPRTQDEANRRELGMTYVAVKPTDFDGTLSPYLQELLRRAPIVEA